MTDQGGNAPPETVIWLRVLAAVEVQRERERQEIADRDRLRAELAGLRAALRERRQMIESYARLIGPDSILNRNKPAKVRSDRGGAS